MTKKFHILFDKGYITITPDLEVRVSPRLQREWKNGKRYHAYGGRSLEVVPAEDLRPEPRVLDWPGRHVLLGFVEVTVTDARLGLWGEFD